MKRKKGWLLLCLILCFLVGCGKDGSSSGGSWTKSLESDELIRVGEAVCPVAEAMIFVTTQKNIYQDSYGGDIWSVKLEDGTFESYILDGVKAYMGRLFVSAEMARAEGMELTDAEAELVALAAAEYMASLDASDLSATGLTQGIVASTFEQYILAQRVYASVMEEEAVEVSDDEARVIQIQRIFLSTEGLDPAAREEKRVLAEKIWNQLMGGEKEFVALAETYHEAEDWSLEVMRGQLSAEEEAAAYGLESGAISELVETEDGFVILKCIHSLEEEATAVHKKELLEQKKNQVYQEQLDAFLREQPAIFNEKAWEKIGIATYPGAASANFYTVYQKYFTE